MQNGAGESITQLIQQGRDREAAELGSAAVPDASPGATRGDAEAVGPVDQLAQLVPLLDDLVSGLSDEDLRRPTACAAFDVGDVLAHMVRGGTAFAAAFRGEEAPAAEPQGDLRDAFPAAMGQLLEAMRSPGALDRTIAAPFGDVPGEAFARFVALDGLVHGWDVAAATGQPYDPPAEVVTEATAFAEVALTDDLRDGDTFAAPVDAPAGASPLLRLVAFTGRRPS